MASDPAVRAEMQEILHLAAEPLRPHDNGKSRLARAAAVLKLGRRRAYALWYGEQHTLIREEEAARLRAERDRLLELRITRLRQEIVEAERQLQEARRANLEAAEDLDRAAASGRGEVDYTLGCGAGA